MKNKSLEYFWNRERKSRKTSSSSSPLSKESLIIDANVNEQEVNESLGDENENEANNDVVNEQIEQTNLSGQNEKEANEFVNEQTDQQANQSDQVNEQNEQEIDEIEIESLHLAHDPGKRKPISSYSINDRDIVRRRYIDMTPCRPKPPRGEFSQTLIGKKMRRFSLAWYDKYDWIEYSEQNDAAFCFYCYLFKDDTRSPGGDVFVSGGWKCWKKTERLVKHVGGLSSGHNEAREKYEIFTNQKTTIVEKFVKISLEAKNLYKSRLICSLQCLRFLLKQGLAFRGHDESEGSRNRGNFRELLKWLSGNSKRVAKIISSAPGNHKAIAPKIQKELINCCAKETTKLLIEDLNNDFFAILADESSDVSHKEMLALCLRYVDKSGKVCERFLGIEHVADTTSKTLLVAITSLLDGHSLMMSNIRGQGYDGASNMRGEINGLKNLVMRNAPSAYYVHCFAHQLQLTLVAVAKQNTDCSSFFYELGFVLNVIGISCKRLELVRVIQAQKLLEALELNETLSGKGLNQNLGLSRPGDTRWGSHFKSILNLIALYPTIIEVLVIVGEDAKCGDDRAKAQHAIGHLESFEFIFMLHLMKVIFGYTNVLCEALQRKDQDIVNAMSLVSLTKEYLQNSRDNGWDNFLDMVCVFCAKYNIEVPIMNDTYSTRGRSRRFFAKVTNLHRYRIEMFISVIDLQLQELNNRFNEVSTELLLCMSCLSPVNSFASFDKQKLLRLAEFYPNEFSAVDIMTLEFQLDIFVGDMRKDLRFQYIKSLGELSMKLVETNKHLSYPLVYLLLKLVLLLPVATASVERVFSSMTYVKNKLRNSIGDELLNNCLVTFIEKDFFSQVSDDDVLKRYHRVSRRGQYVS